MNPFLQPYTTEFGVPPFDQLRDEHYEPAFNTGFQQQNQAIKAITDCTDAPTFENTIVPYERSGTRLQQVSLVFFNLLSAHTNENLNDLAAKIRPQLASHRDQIFMNHQLFVRVDTIYQQLSQLQLTGEQKRLVQELHKRFTRAGVDLPAEQRERLQAINQQLATLSVQYHQNLLAENNTPALIIDDHTQLDGLPKNLIAQAAALAEKLNHQGKWVFTPTRVNTYPFLQNATNRQLRAQMYQAYVNRGNNDNQYDNKKIAQDMSTLRLEKSRLLGYQNHADYALADTMAKSTDRVMQLLDQVWKACIEMAKKDVEELQALMDEEEAGRTFQASDWWFYSEKIRQQKYNFSADDIRPYFSAQNGLQGAFLVAKRLFGITFKERFDLPLYHPDVRTFELTDKSDKTIGIFYIDYYARPSKRGGAWMSSYRIQQRLDGETIPIVVNVCNFPPPTQDAPSLLSLQQVKTLFHEFGHALHGLLSDVTYPTLAGTAVPSDYVEFPSQMMENWGRAAAVIHEYAAHYQTGESIPAELLQKISEASTFNQGFATTEYVAAAYLDMAWHTCTEEITDTTAFEQQTLQKLGLIPQIASRYRSTYFSHIFAGGYAAGYYSYLWTEVLEADAFQVFASKGLYDQESAEKLQRYVYAAGNTDDLMTQYIRFRGAEPQIDALLEKRGLHAS